MRWPGWRRANGGSYIRSGDGDRRLTRYEVTQLLSNSGQPTEDLEPVTRATQNDLDPQAVSALLARVRQRQPKALAGLNTDDALQRLGVLTHVEDRLVPTLAGLLCLGVYPQQFFPQLNVTFVALPGLAMGEQSPTGQRFLDNQSCDGSIPDMVALAVQAVVRNMTRAAVIAGVGRQDRYEYPVEVVRELIVNALMHRDYSSSARGTQVQVELYPDRFVVRSPGGIFGTVDAASFGAPDVTSSRNATMARLLSEVALPDSQEVVSENRGSGIPAIMASLKASGMTPPRFDVSITRVQVVVPKHALLDSETLEWLASLDLPDLSDGQRMALAMMRSGLEVSNETLRGWGLHRVDATASLADLVRRGIVERTGGRRYATYRLVEPQEPPSPDSRAAASGQTVPSGQITDEQWVPVLDSMINHGDSKTREIETRLGLTYKVVLRRINQLIDNGWVRPSAPPKSKNRTYAVTPEGLAAFEDATREK